MGNVPSMLGAATMPGPLTVILLGLGIVFVGLICIILLIMFMGAIMSAFGKKAKKKVPVNEAGSNELPDDQTISVIASVLAQEMGADVKRLHIKSIKRV